MANEGENQRVFNVEIDGETHEVPVPEGWVPADELKENYVPQATVHSAVRRATKGLVKPEDLMEDDEFLGRIAEARRDDLMERLGIKPGAEKPDEQQLDRLLAKWREKEVEPLKSELTQRDEELTALRQVQLQAEIRKAFADLDVDTEGGNDELIELWVEKRTTYDPEHRAWVVMGEGGEPDFVVEDGKPRPKTPADLLREIRKSGTKPGWFRDTVREGVGYRGNANARPGSKKIADMGEAEKAEYIEEHGLDKYLDKLSAERRAARNA